MASKDPDFQVSALVGALARIVEAQQEELDRLGRVKATAAALSAVKKEIASDLSAVKKEAKKK